MYVPTFQGLRVVDLVRSTAPRSSCFPFDAPRCRRFYRARNAIYHLFLALGSRKTVTVLAPDYNSGNEIAAIDAAGGRIHYYTVDRDMQLDPYEVERLCKLHNPDVLYVIHYLGWPQPMTALVDLCRRRGMFLVEDCALALLSASGDRSLGTFGDWSIFCLYKTLPVPNGALLVENATALEGLDRLRLRPVSKASVAGRTAELLVQRLRSRVDTVGAVLQAGKRALGHAAGAMDVDRAKVGDIGFDLSEVDFAMSSFSNRLLERLDFADIRRRRVKNFQILSELVDNKAKVCPRLPPGACPLFLPILVADKPAAANALRRRGVEALEFWNYGMEACDRQASATTRFLRQHVLGLPIHQDLTPRHISHMAQLVSGLHLSTTQLVMA
jgi:dTDP-4-amino-4,6-dideoxygalactose transaminase